LLDYLLVSIYIADRWEIRSQATTRRSIHSQSAVSSRQALTRLPGRDVGPVRPLVHKLVTFVYILVTNAPPMR